MLFTQTSVFAGTPTENDPYSDYPCLRVGDKYFFSIDLFFKNDVRYTPQICLDGIISSDMVCQEIVELSPQKNSYFTVKNNDVSTIVPDNYYRLIYTCDESYDKNEFSHYVTSYMASEADRQRYPGDFNFHGLISLKCWTKHPERIFESKDNIFDSVIRFTRADFEPLKSCENNSKTEKFLYQIRKSCLLGDCNIDGSIDIADSVSLIKLSVDKEIELMPLNKNFCLVDLDNVVNILDANTIQKYMVNRDIGKVVLHHYDVLYDKNNRPLPEKEIVKLLY